MTDKATETLARALSRPYDPDEICGNGRPRWEYYIPKAEAVQADIESEGMAIVAWQASHKGS